MSVAQEGSETMTTSCDPIRALRALAVLCRDPDDTAQVFTIIESLSGRTPERVLARFAADPEGARLLRDRPDIVPVLADRARLRAMPAGSLAHAYLDFVESEGIDADGLVAASDAGERGIRPAGSDLEYLADRLRDTHDLWHALTGYRGDLRGEAALLAFSLPHTHNPGVGLIVLLGLARLHEREATRLIADAIRRGARAAWLPAIDWEALLPQPVDGVRARLGIDAPPSYVPLRSSELRELGMLDPRPARAA